MNNDKNKKGGLFLLLLLAAGLFLLFHFITPNVSASGSFDPDFDFTNEDDDTDDPSTPSPPSGLPASPSSPPSSPASPANQDEDVPYVFIEGLVHRYFLALYDYPYGLTETEFDMLAILQHINTLDRLYKFMEVYRYWLSEGKAKEHLPYIYRFAVPDLSFFDSLRKVNESDLKVIQPFYTILSTVFPNDFPQ